MFRANLTIVTDCRFSFEEQRRARFCYAPLVFFSKIVRILSKISENFKRFRQDVKKKKLNGLFKSLTYNCVCRF